jgi:hypothetical protein
MKIEIVGKKNRKETKYISYETMKQYYPKHLLTYLELNGKIRI